MKKERGNSMLQGPLGLQDSQKCQFYPKQKKKLSNVLLLSLIWAVMKGLSFPMFTDGQTRLSRHADWKQPRVITMKGVCGALMRHEIGFTKSSLSKRCLNLRLISGQNIAQRFVALAQDFTSLESKRLKYLQEICVCTYLTVLPD